MLPIVTFDLIITLFCTSFQRALDGYLSIMIPPNAPPLMMYLHEPGYELMYNFFFFLYEVNTLPVGDEDHYMMDVYVEKEVYTDRFAKCDPSSTLGTTLGKYTTEYLYVFES